MRPMIYIQPAAECKHMQVQTYNSQKLGLSTQ